MFKNLLKLIKRIYIDHNYTLNPSKGFYKNSTLLKKNIIFFYEIGCFLQKKKLNFLSDLIFSTPYYFYSIFNIKNLSFAQISYLFNSDKSLALDKNNKHTNSSFSLANNYDRYFEKIRNNKLKILEIGIGGHDSFHRGGSSLRALSKYFKNSKIFGIDIVEKKLHDRRRIKTLNGSQIDEHFLKEIVNKYGPFDLIIDDGSHYVDHQNFSFDKLFPSLNDNGIYIIEDIIGSYIKYMGGSINLNDDKNLVTRFSKFTHNVFSEYIFSDELKKLNQNISISSIQFYSKNGRGCLILEKSNNIIDGTKTEKEFKLDSEEIKKYNPGHRHNQKKRSGLIVKDNKD
tara:strand:- start:297 stop:1322 length:1026 start_codon:yes stop_codon:yes gene_type:complete